MLKKKRFEYYYRRFKFPHFLSSLVNGSAAKQLGWFFSVCIAEFIMPQEINKKFV